MFWLPCWQDPYNMWSSYWQIAGMLSLLLRHTDLNSWKLWCGWSHFITFAWRGVCVITLSDTVMHWHYKLGETEGKYFPFPVTQCVRCEMNAMVDEQLQAVALTLHTRFHWNCCVSASLGADINNSDEWKVFHLYLEKEKDNDMIGGWQNFQVNRVFAKTFSPL